MFHDMPLLALDFLAREQRLREMRTEIPTPADTNNNNNYRSKKNHFPKTPTET